MVRPCSRPTVRATSRGSPSSLNPATVCSSGDNLALGAGVFDCVVFTDVLEHIPPAMVDGVIAEIHRVLKPGGRVYLDYPGSKLPYYTGYPVINAGIGYQWRPAITFSIDANNLTNAPQSAYRGIPDRMQFKLFGGTTITAGINGRF